MDVLRKLPFYVISVHSVKDVTCVNGWTNEVSNTKLQRLH